MGYSKAIYDKAWATLTRRKQEAGDRELARREEIHSKIPEISRIESEMARCAASVAKAIVAAPECADERVAALQKQSLEQQRRRQELLLQSGYPPDYLAEQHGCAVCRDKGYVGLRMCSCLEQQLKRCAYDELGAVSRAERCSFQNFSLEYYPDQPVDSSGVIPRQRMGQILEACRHYAEEFSRDSESLLLLGQTGLGKTHLSLAIGALATEAGFGVVYTPVQRLMDRLEADKFSRSAEAKGQYADSVEHVLGCDLLILDDLGAEFGTSFTTSMLYSVINTRLAEGRPSIISTNLALGQIEEKYSSRVVSRLVCSYRVLKFYGKDIRFLKRQAGAAQ